MSLMRITNSYNRSLNPLHMATLIVHTLVIASDTLAKTMACPRTAASRKGLWGLDQGKGNTTALGVRPPLHLTLTAVFTLRACSDITHLPSCV
jgi:hypothetical protein